MSGQSLFEDRVQHIICSVYPEVRKIVVEAETKGKIAHWRVWVESIRTGLDDFVVGLRLHHDGHEKEALQKMDEAEWHFWTGAYEAWMRTAVVKSKYLHRAIRSKLSSSTTEVMKIWNEVQELLVKARTEVPNHDPRAVAVAREAALKAIGGLDLISSQPTASIRIEIFLVGLFAITGSFLSPHITDATWGPVAGAAVGSVTGWILGTLLGRRSSGGI